MGDVHREWFNVYGLLDRIERRKLTHANIIQCGDWGVGFVEYDVDMKDMEALNECLKSVNVKIFVIRGNHDDPKYFNGNISFSNLKLVRDYEVFSIDGFNILPIGGATSIDKEWRKIHGYGWWPNEKVFLNEKRLKTFENVDIVVSHTAPIFVKPFVIDKVFDISDKLKKELEDERRLMEKIFNILHEKNSIRYWFYGHFHGNSEMVSAFETYESVDFRFLDEHEIFCL